MNRPYFSYWNAFEAWLSQKGLFHMELGLERISQALSDCKLDSPPYRAAQVLGTNGKGSTSAFLASLAQAHGLRAGLFTSPHFRSPRERILINGQELSGQTWIMSINRLARLTDITRLTYFELLTLLAAWLFASHEVEFAVFEAGLGGRNDATSAIKTDCLCFTPIALDHANIIGPDIAAIASDKAAAIKADAQIFSAPQYPPAAAMLDAAAKRHCSTVSYIAPAHFTPGLAGSHQRINAGLALAAWRSIAQNLRRPSLAYVEAESLKNTFLPGRLQRLAKTSEHPEIILDGAHNPHSISQLCRTYASRPAAVIYSALADKDWRSCLPMILRKTSRMIIPQLANGRAARADEIAEFGNGIRHGSCTPARDLPGALAQLQSGPILICGSFYLLADFYKLYPQYLERKKHG